MTNGLYRSDTINLEEKNSKREVLRKKIGQESISYGDYVAESELSNLISVLIKNGIEAVK